MTPRTACTNPLAMKPARAARWNHLHPAASCAASSADSSACLHFSDSLMKFSLAQLLHIDLIDGGPQAAEFGAVKRSADSPGSALRSSWPAQRRRNRL